MGSALQVLPVAVRNVLDKRVHTVVIKMCRVFQKLCEKEIRQDDEPILMLNVVMAACWMEKEFPPTILNVMMHLSVHLVQ